MLTNKIIISAKPKSKPYRLNDQKGLFIRVMPNGSKYWRFRFRWNNKDQQVSLGLYPNISINKARRLAVDARFKLFQKIYPNPKKNNYDLTFINIAYKWLETQDYCREHYEIVNRRMEKFIFPRIGNHRLEQIDSSLIFNLLHSIEILGKIETAHRIKYIIGQVFRYSIARGWTKYDPTFSLKDALKPRKVKHMAAITDPIKLKKLLLSIDGYDGHISVQYALKLAPYLFVRPGNLRQMEWDELYFDEALWRIPANKMKGKQNYKKMHIVPLSHKVLKELMFLKNYTGYSNYCFPSIKHSTRPISDNALLSALRVLGWTKEEVVTHGFRTTASTLLNEQGWSPDIIEKQLAHVDNNSVRSIYNRAEYLDKRRSMMQFWSDYLDSLKNSIPNLF